MSLWGKHVTVWVVFEVSYAQVTHDVALNSIPLAWRSKCRTLNLFSRTMSACTLP